MPTSYHLTVAAVDAAAQPGQLHTAASAARAAEQDWRRISGSYAGAAARQPDSSQSMNSGTAAPLSTRSRQLLLTIWHMLSMVYASSNKHGPFT